MADDKKEVLILDERSDSLMDLFDLVYREGWETTGVSSEKEALSCVARRKPDVLIEHLRDSITAAPAFVERLRHLSPRTRIILLSGRPSEPTRQTEESREGAVEWIPGPFQGSKLIDALDRAFQAAPPGELKREAVPSCIGRPGPAIS
jgi:DNA-binding NtrC family response regulator